MFGCSLCSVCWLFVVTCCLFAVPVFVVCCSLSLVVVWCLVFVALCGVCCEL